MPDEELLSGGNMGAVVRIGDTVRRISGPWTAAVHRLFAYRIAPFAEDAREFDPQTFGSPDERVELLLTAYGAAFDLAEVRAAAAIRLDDLATFTEGRLAETGRAEFGEHAAMYRRDAERLRS